jgi:hypothetical protein
MSTAGFVQGNDNLGAYKGLQLKTAEETADSILKAVDSATRETSGFVNPMGTEPATYPW